MRKSCIYEGRVRHRRNSPTHHQFDFRLFMLLLDLDEIDSMRGRWLLSTGRFSFARFNQAEHLTAYQGHGNLKSRVEAALISNGFPKPIGPIRILTQLSYLGFSMNPVSFIYCYDATGEQVRTIIAEVNNTPWGEQHLYFLSSNADSQHSTTRADQIQKSFHVSPFLSREMSYRMALTSPRDRLGIKIENHLDQPENGVRRILDVTMLMERRALTTSNLGWMFVKYPLASFKTFFGIYFQALRLYLKKVPFFPHPNKATQTTKSETIAAVPDKSVSSIDAATTKSNEPSESVCAS